MSADSRFVAQLSKWLSTLNYDLILYVFLLCCYTICAVRYSVVTVTFVSRKLSTISSILTVIPVVILIDIVDTANVEDDFHISNANPHKSDATTKSHYDGTIINSPMSEKQNA